MVCPFTVRKVSETGDKRYTVRPDVSSPQCTCPDFEIRRIKCKQIRAVEYTLPREVEGSNDGQTVTDYEFNHSWFMQQYHKRSNVGSTFSMIKAKFGDSLRSKTTTAGSTKHFARCSRTISPA